VLFGFFLAGMSGAFVFSVLNHAPVFELNDTMALAFIGFGVIGFLLALRESRNPIGWIFLAVGAGFASVGFSEEYIRYTLVTHPRALPGGLYVAWYYNWAWLPFLVSILTFPFLLFPTGRLLSKRWKPVVWVAIACIALGSVAQALNPELETPHVRSPLGLEGAKTVTGAVFGLSFLFIPFLLLASVVSLFLRFRRASQVERQQIKWFAFSGALLLVGITVGLILEQFLNTLTPDAYVGVLLCLPPIAAGIAILKYRLYDIDIVINKAVVNGALAAFITLVYVGIVVGVGSAIGQGDRPNLGLSILATAVVAVAFQPVRERIQRFANRLVYGKRATPYEVLAHFAERMASIYAADELLPQMARILAEGTGAARAEVWLLVGDVLRPEGSWPPGGGASIVGAKRQRAEAASIPGADISLEVQDRGETLGAIGITKPRGEPVTDGDRKLLQDLASQAGLVLRNVKLIEELRASRQRIVSAQDNERRRIERNIHDGAQQQLVALNVKLGLAKTLAKKDREKTDQMLAQLQSETQDALENLRDLARGIYPPLLADQGLSAALHAQARKSAVPVRVESDGVPRFPQEVEAAVYFSVSEALQNVAKYANASRATVRLRSDDGQLDFEVEDDGSGFDPSSTGYGTGLQGIADRLSALGGELDVRSTLGSGTIVVGRLPVRTSKELVHA
jgi:signal transduction histidine kinase